ncbi:zinc ABC transporter substrate-binding protein [Dactylosporangium aurantiacum]|uniref:Zinc ABC transporter substrate-binding protein n=1 Tax=Dactylosporangium aurantiacum TaxID=35754 RepID=A0A9Q9MGW9_9ACTN|nr:metal ABC transporter substrate-binding protein [Dactylosporangium aurantiacum]MDG6103415.1 metal ABC transporter substrate-binding protein [Dactylosporangium aurantiacum]UWZ52076.1 zinc ABC transporter substrate-binding protein [Dactylosporangium aurantiacum]
MLRRAVLAGLTAGSLMLSTACGGDGEPAQQQRQADGRLRIVAGFYPLQYMSERVGAEDAAVTNLTQGGAEPHDLELKPSQLAQVSDAALVVYLNGFQPSVDEAVRLQAKDKAFDVAAVERLAAGGEHGGDPHVWLDPVRFAVIVGKLGERIAALDPANADAIKVRAGQLQDELHRLDEEYTAGLRTCARREIVTSHAAFGYLAGRYHLTQVPISGLDPDEEPSPQRVSQVAALAKEKGATTIFFEALVSPKLSQTIAKEIGAKAAVLDPIEGVEDGDDYVSVMVRNLAALREALGCT